MDRSKDPSPFAWIFGGALVLISLGAALSVLRKGNQAQMEDPWARPEPLERPVGTAAADAADADGMLDGHPS